MPSTNDNPPRSRLLGEGRGAAEAARIVALRPPKNAVDPWRPYAFLVEPERTRDGAVEDTAVLFLTNRECPFRCLMCDLWKNTTDARVPAGAVAAQVEYALARLPAARHVKLYNAGNFFDAQAIPRAEWGRLTDLLGPFRTIIIENHPRLVGPRCLEFRDRLRPALEVAMGLETVHPGILPRLNKGMTLTDFAAATRFLTGHGVAVRAFLLLRPPFLSEGEGVRWARASIRFAFDAGVECCVVIPTRAGNGVMDELQRQGHFTPPRLESLEEVLEYGVGLRGGRVFADLWDVARLQACARCGPARVERMRLMNLTQQALPAVACPREAGR
jgi:radical SAM enzyme (TIGR01210 family)